MSRRERRDSETSTDSWSLVEEDRLDDDFSLTSTDNEGAELETAEPIVEEPITSDEEDEDTASEKSLDSESEDSDVSVNSESEDEESDVEEAEEAVEDIVEEGEIEIQEESDLSDEESLEDLSSDEDSDLSDEEEDEEIIEEEDVQNAFVQTDFEETEEEKVARTCKEQDYYLVEGDEDTTESNRRSCRALLAFTLFIMLFPLADIFTSWMLTLQNHRASHNYGPDVVVIDSLQSYRSLQEWTKVQESFDLKKWRRQQKLNFQSDRNSFHLLKDILDRPNKQTPQLKSHEVLEMFTNKSYNWKRQSDVVVPVKISEIPKEFPKIIDLEFGVWLNYQQNISQTYAKSRAQCRALAPIPPAPFTPRRVRKSPVPRHQPCFVHVNQSKWTCQKNLPSVIYNTSPNYTVMPRGFTYTEKKRGMGYFKKSKTVFTEKYDICGKKASQSMRSALKPTDQCHTRQLSKFTPRRKHIAYKAPLPCKIPTYKPTIPKKSYKPSTSDDWLQKRSQHRAQLRQRA